METIADDGSEELFVFVTTDIVIDIYNKVKDSSTKGRSTIQESIGTIVPEKTRFQLLFFSEGRENLKRMA